MGRTSVLKQEGCRRPTLGLIASSPAMLSPWWPCERAFVISATSARRVADAKICCYVLGWHRQYGGRDGSPLSRAGIPPTMPMAIAEAAGAGRKGNWENDVGDSENDDTRLVRRSDLTLPVADRNTPRTPIDPVYILCSRQCTLSAPPPPCLQSSHLARPSPFSHAASTDNLQTTLPGRSSSSYTTQRRISLS